MKQSEKDYDTLIAALQNHPEGISIQEVADLMGVHRNTAAKYLEVLQSRGDVDVRRIGVSKLFIASRRVPFSCVIRLFEEPVIGVDRDLSIIDINESAAAFLGDDIRSIAGRSILQFQSALGSEVAVRIRDVLKGRWCSWENGLRGKNIISRGIPVKFNDNRTGAALILCDQDEVLGVRAELNQYKEVLQFIHEHQTEFIFRITPDLTYGWVNPAYARLFLLNPEQMIGTRFSLRVPETEQNHIIRCIRESPPEGSTIEYRVHLPPGDIRHLQIFCRPVPASDLEGGYVCVGRDISEFKLKEEQFRRFYDGTEGILSERTRELRDLSRQLYQEIAEREQIETMLRSIEFAVQHVADLIIWFDTSGLITYSNQAAHNILNLSDGEGMKIRSYIPEPPSGDWNTFWDTLRLKRTLYHETLIISSDNQAIPAEILFNHMHYGKDEYCCCIARDIHERNQAIAELIESANRFHQLTSTIPEVFFLRDLSTDSLLYINKAFEQVFGLPISQIYQNPQFLTDWIHPDDQEMVMEYLGRSGGDSHKVEYRIVKPDGSLRWLDVRIYVIRDAADQPYRDVGVISDITDHKLMEEELKLLNDRLLITLKATPVSVFNQDLDLRYTWIGQSSLGLSAEDLIGKTDDDLFLPEVSKNLTFIKQNALDTGIGIHTDVDIEHRGQIWTVRMFIEPFRDARENIAGITVAAIDLSDLFRVKEALRVSEEKYRLLFDETNDISVIFSIIRDGMDQVTDFEYIDINRRALDLMGRTKQEVIGSQISDFRPDIDPTWAIALREVAESGKQVCFDGYSEYFSRNISVHAYPTGDGHIGVLARDISDLIRAHEQVKHQRDLALALAATDDLDEAMHLILDAGKMVPGIDAGGIYFVDEMGEFLYLYSYSGLSQEFAELVSRVPVTPEIVDVYRRGVPIYHRVGTPSVAHTSVDILLDEGLKTVVILPIFNNGKFYALLNLTSHTLEEIPANEHPHLETLAAHLGEALSRLKRGVRGPEGPGDASLASQIQTFIQILDPEGRILEGSTPFDRDGFTADQVREMISGRKDLLYTGQEISHIFNPGTGSDHRSDGSPLYQVRVRFIPWGREVAYLVIWERSSSF